MIDGWLIYNREDYEKNRAFADLFTDAGAKRGLVISLKFRDEIGLLLCDGKLSAATSGAALPAFVINRTRDSLLGLFFELAGCCVYNSSKVTSTGNDKMLSHLLAARLGIPQVEMAFCENNPGSLAAHGLGYPVVLKSPYSHGGGEVFLVHNERELLAAASGISSEKLIVQRLCGKPGADVRVYVLGGKILAAVKRSSFIDFRANLSLGGSVEPYALGRAEEEAVQRIVLALRPDYAGIDFIFNEDGSLLFNEIEDVVGARSLYQLGGVDVVGLFLDHIAAHAAAGNNFKTR